MLSTFLSAIIGFALGDIIYNVFIKKPLDNLLDQVFEEKE